MALVPKDKKHEKQIKAGIIGRKKGHKFEALLANEINNLSFVSIIPGENIKHIYQGNPAMELLQYIANDRNIQINAVKASWLGGLATSGLGDAIIDENGHPITKSKSDVLLRITAKDAAYTIGISVKTCNKKTPTNDQMFFTTAKAFCQLLIKNGINVTKEAEQGMSMFCGDIGYRPIDMLDKNILKKRISDPFRFYWEEIGSVAQDDWREIFTIYQDEITRLLFQKAYKDDPYSPDYLLHQTTKYKDFNNCEAAIFSMDEIVHLSRKYSGYILSKYVIRKGTYKNDNNMHLAPRFGFIQFQRGGQKQHPTQLQFNLKAGYFKHV